MDVDPTFSVFDETKLDPPPTGKDSYSDIDAASIPNGGKFFSTLTDLSNPREKAEALLCVLAMLCIDLNTRIDPCDKHHFQSVFARVFFYNKSRLLPFPTTSNIPSTTSHLHPRAESFLHGKLMMDLLTPPEEAFIRFVTFVDLVRFHSASLMAGLVKYASLFHINDSTKLCKFLDSHKLNYIVGDTKVKGFRTEDIAIFNAMKSRVYTEREKAKSLPSHIPDAHGEVTASGKGSLPSKKSSIVCPLCFHYPLSVAVVKEEFSPTVLKNKKRKLSVQEGETDNATTKAMDIDVSGVFDYDKDTLTTWTV